MNRYFCYISYIGTQFKGVQKLINRNESYKLDSTTIQGILEIGLQKLKPINEIHVVPSSRTDTGVHAIKSTFHVDLERKNGKIYEPQGVTTVLNKYFNINQYFVRILNTDIVSNDFHCRYNAKSRTYLYRLGIIRKRDIKQINNVHLCHIPIEEYGRCHFICAPDFDMDKVIEMSKIFTGLNDFRTFMGKGSKHLDKNTVRNMEIEICKGKPSIYWPEGNITLSRSDDYEYWNFIFKSEGFLYNQVRRLVGALIAVGQNRVSIEDLQLMLREPSHLSWNPKIVLAPPHGLYLWQVDYS